MGYTVYVVIVQTRVYSVPDIFDVFLHGFNSPEIG